MGWILSSLKYVLLAVAIIFIVYMAYQYNECDKKGKKSGKAYKCPIFCKEPISLLPIDEYYDLSNGECYHYIDYGDRMSVRKVGMDKCD